MLYRFALRQGRWGLAGYSLFAFLLGLVQTAGFYQVAGHTAAERAAFGKSMTLLAAQFTVIVPEPLRPDTVGGYVQWRAYGFAALVFGIWALASAVGASRGDEERGLVETVLAAGVSKADLVMARVVVFAAAVLVAAISEAAGVYAGLDRSHDWIDPGAVAAASLLLIGLALSCYALALLICQLVAARLAASVAGVVLLMLFLVNSLGRSLDVLRPWRWLSPFYYYDLSRPLAPGGTIDVRATEVLFAVAVISGLAAAIGFVWRDLGSPLIRFRVRGHQVTQQASTLALWQIPVVRGLYDRRTELVAWTAGTAVLAAVFVILTKSIVQPLLGISELAPYFRSIIHGEIYPSFLGFVWFGVAQLLFAGYAISQVARWSAEDSDGRLEMTLSEPMGRGLVLLERTFVLTVSLLIIAIAAGVALGFESSAQSITVGNRKLIEASLLLVPFSMMFAAVGSVIAARIPRAALGLLAGFAIASYFVTQVGPVFKWPEAVEDLSPFQLYGQPLSTGVDATGLAIMLIVIALGLAGSAFLMNRRDIAA
jgi:ABC-2 type transport system permease protein